MCVTSVVGRRGSHVSGVRLGFSAVAFVKLKALSMRSRYMDTSTTKGAVWVDRPEQGVTHSKICTTAILLLLHQISATKHDVIRKPCLVAVYVIAIWVFFLSEPQQAIKSARLPFRFWSVKFVQFSSNLFAANSLATLSSPASAFKADGLGSLGWKTELT